MTKKRYIPLAVILFIMAAVLLIYPHIIIQSGDLIIACRYSDDISQFETEVSADENYVYWEEKDVTWSGFDVKKFGPFHLIYLETEPGNTIASKYALDPGYMDQFLANAVIDVVEKDYNEVDFTVDDVEAILADKSPVDSGDKYTCPDYDTAYRIYYTLVEEETIMYLYEVDDLLVVQVGYPDEGPKYIAYR